VLPFEWVLLRNSVTNACDGSPLVEHLARRCNVDTIAVKGSLRLSWPADPGDQSEAHHVRAMPLTTGSQPSTLGQLLTRLGIDRHPGLVARWQPPSRRVTICPGCKLWRRLNHDDHTEWQPDALDITLCPLPPHLMQSQAEQSERLKSLHSSSRNAEEFEAGDLLEMALAQLRSSALKCTCEGGSDLCRFIGVPPARTRKGFCSAAAEEALLDVLDGL